MSGGPLRSTVIRGGGLVAAGWGFGQALTFASYVALARLVTPEEFGLYTAGLAVVMVGLMVAESGMGAALIQRDDRLEQAANTALFATTAGGLGLCLVVLAMSPLIGLILDSDEATEVVAVMSGLALLRSSATVPDALLQRRFSYVRRTIVEPASMVAFAAVAIPATSSGMGVWGLVLGQYAAGLVEVGSTWAFARWRPRPRLASLEMWRELVDYSRFLIAAGVVNAGGTYATRLLVGGALGASSLGQYGYALRIAGTPQMALVAAASWVLFPAFSRIKGDRERFRQGVLSALRWTSIFALPLGLILIPLGESTAVILFGEKWRAAGEAAAALGGFAAAGALASVSLEAVKASGRSHLVMRGDFVAAVLTVLAIVVLQPFGLTAVGAGISIATVGGLIYSLTLAARVAGFQFNDGARVLLAPAIAAAAMVASLLGLNAAISPDARGTIAGLALLAAEFVVGMAVYLAVLELVRPGASGDLVGLVRTATSRRSSSPLTAEDES